MTYLWEQHTCLPLESTADITELARYPAHSYLSVNVGYSPHSSDDANALLDDFQRKALDDGRFDLVSSVTDIDEARAAGRRALAFDLEDSGPLDGDLDNVRHFYTRGVRSLLPSYNHANAAGCGCLDATDTGLTRYGRDLVREMNAVGMFVDGSHCSAQTGLDICSATEAPMIYSHSNFASVWAHPRNITDEQARACASTGGVIGINGVGIFLGVNAAEQRRERVEAMADHVEYGVGLVGIAHVGVGSDYSFDHEEFNAALIAHPEAFSDEYTKYGPLRWVPPEDTVTVPDVLRGRGFDDAAVDAVFGGNFRRIAGQVWK
ncbi:membrane dipeptidase [Rhodococcoides trifolii]|uniref:Membrane dipeptidase n=1 Tax=Rhodococcoides trifolii TaxID=908250 RepID=A0A917FPS7_9NOCA|nr:membrane dipeptidase [Rhodococcus trifolii]GGF95213.1 membrane dipeptidase [Rhodococcus trifolii]